jgi:serine/threonine-protein kinase RsbW
MKFEFSLCLPRDAISVPFVRHLCRAALENVGAEGESIDDMELAVSEACSNVLRHAAGTEQEYELRVRIEDNVCTIRVIDTGAGFEEATLVGPELNSESGRGIHLMRHLVDRLNFESKPDTGTIVELQKTLAIRSGSVLDRLRRVVNLSEKTSA